MRIIVHILLFGIISCNDHEHNLPNQDKSDITTEKQDFFDSTNQNNVTNSSELFYNEFEITPHDSLFLKLDLELKEISEQDFKNYEKNYHPNCQIDSNGFIGGKGLKLETECHEICMTTIFEIETDKRIILPCTYDQGILGLSFSNSCDQFVTFACYDSPDYDNFYEYRSELIGYKISKDQGLDCIKPYFEFSTKDWSISELIWINNQRIAIKVYTEGIPTTGNDFGFKYYTTEI